MTDGKFETRRDERGSTFDKHRRGPANLREDNVVQDLASEFNRACVLLRQGITVPSMESLLGDLVSRYGFDQERSGRIIEGTFRIAAKWSTPIAVGHTVPDARIAAMDSITKEETDELRKLWGRQPIKERSNLAGADVFRALLISCRALLLVEKYPDLYRLKKKPMQNPEKK